VRDYVIEHLADDDAVLVIDETGFLKQGKASCGSGAAIHRLAGKITTARSESSLPTFRATVMRSSIVRCIFRRNGPPIQIAWKPHNVPPDAGFATKPKLATRMIARAIAASVPFKWVAGDTVYGVGDIEQQRPARQVKATYSGSAVLMCSQNPMPGLPCQKEFGKTFSSAKFSSTFACGATQAANHGGR